MEYANPVTRILRRPGRAWSIVGTTLSWLKMYFTTQTPAAEAEAMIIETAVDDRIEPDSRAIYPYLFACVYILAAAWYVFDRLSTQQYKQAKEAYKTMLSEAEQIFSTVPTKMRNRQRSNHPLTLFTQEIDGPTNCFPSLHVALVVLSYQFIKDHLELEESMFPAMRSSCIDICRSTLLTKQHSVIDVIGGIELARQTYHEFFEQDFEELLSEVVPELEPEELVAVGDMIDDTDELTELLPKLMRYFGG